MRTSPAAWHGLFALRVFYPLGPCHTCHQLPRHGWHGASTCSALPITRLGLPLCWVPGRPPLPLPGVACSGKAGRMSPNRTMEKQMEDTQQGILKDQSADRWPIILGERLVAPPFPLLSLRRHRMMDREASKRPFVTCPPEMFLRALTPTGRRDRPAK